MWLYGEGDGQQQSEEDGSQPFQEDITDSIVKQEGGHVDMSNQMNVTDSEQDQLQALFADDDGGDVSNVDTTENEQDGGPEADGDGLGQDGGDGDGNEDKGDEDDDSDDDDDIQITIGPVNTTPGLFSATGGGPVNLNIQKRGPSAFTGTPGGAGGTKSGSSQVKQLDMDAEGTINGENIFDVDLSSLEDKPWRKPGADITDYFNYGFNEDTWKVIN